MWEKWEILYIFTIFPNLFNIELETENTEQNNMKERMKNGEKMKMLKVFELDIPIRHAKKLENQLVISVRQPVN